MVSHFRDLEAHRLPVLHLYRHMLRLASCNGRGYINPVIHMFRSRKGTISSYRVKSQLQEAYEWESIMRRNLSENSQDKSLKIQIQIKADQINSKLENIESKLRANQNRHTPEKNTHHKKGKDRLLHYNKPPTGLELESLQSEHRMAKYRSRVFRNSSAVWGKKKLEELDECYLDLILVPEYRKRLEIRILNSKYKRDLRPSVVKFESVVTPLGPFTFLRVPDRRPSPTVGGMIRHLVHNVDYAGDKAALEDQLEMAKQQAFWEHLLYGKDQELCESEWCEPLLSSLEDLSKRQANKSRKLQKHRQTLTARLPLIQNIYEGKRKKRLKQWQHFPAPSTKMHRFTKL